MIIKELAFRLERYLKKIYGGSQDVMSSVSLSEPKNKKFGDLCTNAAMVLSGPASTAPMDLAKDISENIAASWTEVEDVNVARPGFINFKLKDSFLRDGLKQIIASGPYYGENDTGKGTRVNLEYVSSNPTGFLHIGHGRWGVLGDVLSRLYTANGYDVVREYYVNDHGSQVERFVECASCLYARYFGTESEYPQDGYPQDTVSRAVDMVIQKEGKKYIRQEDGATGVDTKGLQKAVVDAMLAEIGKTLYSMGVEFDVWFRESSLYQLGNFEKVIQRLEEAGLAYESDGALWFRSSRFGDEKDRVIIRKDGQPTYFASDIMYLLDKESRSFDLLIYILGADHHGYVDRLRATASALGIERQKLDIIIGQLVNLIKDGRPLKMSRRKGKVYTLRDLIGEVGKDAVRYFFADSSFDTPMDFDIDLAKQKSNQNPVFYVQYAHARIESILAKIGQRPSLKQVQTSRIRLDTQSEREIAKALLFYPDEIHRAAGSNSPYFITQYLYDLASKFHYFYNHYRIIEDGKADQGRLGLVLILKQVLVNALDILGIEAPVKM